MGKLISLLLVCIISVPAIGQFEKGDWTLSGEARVGFSRFDLGEEMIRTEINPKIGYFLSDRFEIGSGLFIDVNDSDAIDGIPPIHFSSIGMNLFSRYYPLSMGEEFFFFVQLDGSVFYNSSEANSQGDWTSYRATISMGPLVFFNPEVALEGRLGYHFVEHETSLSDLDVRSGFPTYSFGLRFFLDTNGKHERIKKLKRGYFSFGVKEISSFSNATLGFSSEIDLWFGLFLKDNLMIGSGLGLELETPNVVHEIIVAPFVQRYIPWTDAFNWYVKAQLSFDYFHFSPTSSNSDYVLIGARMGGGLNYFINNSLALEGGIHFNQNFNPDSDRLPFSPIPNFGLGIDLGLTFFLP